LLQLATDRALGLRRDDVHGNPEITSCDTHGVCEIGVIGDDECNVDIVERGVTDEEDPETHIRALLFASRELTECMCPVSDLDAPLFGFDVQPQWTLI
jgi:hypothetical protein